MHITECIFKFILAAFLCCQYELVFCNEQIFFFGENGDVKNICQDQFSSLTPKADLRIKKIISADGCFVIECDGKTFTGRQGDYIFPVADDGKFISLISEANCDFASLVKWNPEGNSFDEFSVPDKEITGVVSDGKQIYAFIYGSTEWNYFFFDKRMEMLHEKIIKENKKSVAVLWDEKSPVAEKWLGRIVYSDRSESVVLCDVNLMTYSFLSYSEDICNSNKFVINYPASDGKEISAIVTLPVADKKCFPLVVFPHGGPGTISMLAYDYRVNFLVSQGFAVFQPNYRGSRGLGKNFRQQGWGIKGIKRQLDDIKEGVKFIRRQHYIDDSRCYVLGGSWGGYLALALLTLEKDLFDAGVVLFGISDLVAMLKTFPEKSEANPILDKLQYGDINNEDHVDALKNLSPLSHLQKLSVPALIVHFYDDKVVEFEQTAALMRLNEKLKLKNIHFVTRHGDHGFENVEEEKEFYKKIIAFFNKSEILRPN